MPLLSREVLTLRLIIDCDGEEEEDNTTAQDSQHPSLLLRLPVELRLEILRYLLCLDCNRKAHTRRPPQSSISELLYLNPRRILEAAPFKHKGNQEINGSPPIIKSCQLHLAVLKTCKQLYLEGKTVLYRDNKVLAVQAGIKGLGAKLKNYGVPVLGPFPSSRLISGAYDESHPPQFRFDPLVLFTGGLTKVDAPFYICSHMDAADFMHALWIMVKSPFARGMAYRLTLSKELNARHILRTDNFVKLALLPWLHTNINSINFHTVSRNPNVEAAAPILSDADSERMTSIRDEFNKHILATRKESNLHLYRVICDYLERIMLQGEICVDQANFNSGEVYFERVCYEACSLVRTRTSALVDVSSRSKDGINRICKLIAVSAYRLCELRSGSLAQLILKRQEKAKTQARAQANEQAARAKIRKCVTETPKEEDGEQSEDSASTAAEDTSSVASTTSSRTSISEADIKVIHELATEIRFGKPRPLSSNPRSPKSPILPRTSRLEPQLARDLALTSGLLALRLPCASPVPEWNIRLDIMLLRLFAWRNDVTNSNWCVRRVLSNGNAVMNNMKQKDQAEEKKWKPLKELLEELEEQVKQGAPKKCFFETADKIEQIITGLWGERLIPKKGFNGLIWTFRWAG